MIKIIDFMVPLGGRPSVYFLLNHILHLFQQHIAKKFDRIVLYSFVFYMHFILFQCL